MKVKQTLSIEEDILKEVKHIIIDKNMNLSEYFEEAVKEKLEKERLAKLEELKKIIQ
jgi:metal-responsive CopG/Arc/MetJ family transcriptional regulator